MEDALRERNSDPKKVKFDAVLILVLMEDALRELILRRIDCLLVTSQLLENPLDFRGKSVPNRLQIYEFPKLCLTLHEQFASTDARIVSSRMVSVPVKTTML